MKRNKAGYSDVARFLFNIQLKFQKYRHKNPGL